MEDSTIKKIQSECQKWAEGWDEKFTKYVATGPLKGQGMYLSRRLLIYDSAVGNRVRPVPIFCRRGTDFNFFLPARISKFCTLFYPLLTGFRLF